MDQVSNACRVVFDGLDSDSRIYAGFSGGLDSTVLLHALCRRIPAERRKRTLTAVHVDHGLVSASDEWRAHCARFTGSLGIELVSRSLGLSGGSNLEARARSGRYACFEELLKTGDRLVLAHHLADQNESILLHLLQGRGLFGMPTRRRFGAGTLLRPLLSLPRTLLLNYAREHELEWLEDPGNLDLEQDRNFLRHRIVPQLEDRFPELSSRLSRVLAGVEGTDQALIETLELARNPLPLAVFDGLSNQAARSVLRHWLVAHGAAVGVSDHAVANFVDQLAAANDRQPRLTIPAGVLRRHRHGLYLLGPEIQLDSNYPLSPPGSLTLPHGLLEFSAEIAEHRIQAYGALRVTFLPELPGGIHMRVRGHQRRARELMRNAGLPPWERDRQPLLMDECGLVALAGIAVRDAPPEAVSSSDWPARQLGVRWTPAQTAELAPAPERSSATTWQQSVPGAESEEVR